MYNCQRLHDLESKQVIKKDANGRYSWPDGSFIRREGNEYLVQSIERQQKPISSYISINGDETEASGTEVYHAKFDGHAFHYSYDTPNSTSEEEDEPARTFGVQRSAKIISGKRKEVFDGVSVPPPKKSWDARKKSRDEEIRPKENAPHISIPMHLKPVEVHPTN